MMLWGWMLILQLDPLTVQLDAEYLLAQGKWKEARLLLERAYRETPDAYFLKMLAEAAFDAQDYRYVLRVVEMAEARGDSIPVDVWDRALRAAFILGRRAWIQERMPRLEALRDPRIHRLLADIHQNWDDYATSARLYREAWAMEEDPDILNYLGYALLQIGKADSAREVFEDLIARGDTLRGAKGLALVYEKLGDQEKVLEALEMAHQASPGDPQVLYRLARLYIQMEKYAQAYPLLEALVNFDPFAYPYRYLLAQTYFRDRRYRRALEHLGMLAYLYPRRPEVHHLLARTLWALGKPQPAIREARQAYRQAREPQQRRSYRTFLAFLYLATRQPREAVELLRVTPLPFLSDTEVIFLAEAYAMQGDTLRAVRVLRTTTRHREDPGFLVEAAQRLHAWGKTRYAEAVVRRILRRDPEHLDAHFLLALIAADRGDVETARRAYEFLISRDSTNAIYYNNLGYLLLTTGGDLEEARRLIARALELNPDEPAYLDSMGWYYFLVGDLGQAKSYLDRAYLRGGKEDPEILEHLGDLYRRLGQREEAIRYYRDALKRAPARMKPRIREKLNALSSP